MKISKEKPPNYEQILKAFDIADKPVVFTYGDTIYNVPEGYKLPAPLEVHETIHSKQQGDDPASWWEKYISDSKFRLQQEIEAYAAQYKFVKEHFNRKFSDQFLDWVSFDCASEVYGKMTTFQEAHEAIRLLAKKLS